MSKRFSWSKFLCSLVSFLIAGSIANTTAAAQKAAWQEKWNGVVAQAKKEGKVIIVTYMGPKTRSALTEAFKSKYGIDLEFVVGRTAETLPKVLAERRAGLFLTDVVIDGSSTMISLNKNGLLDPIEPALILPDVRDPKSWYRNEIFYYNENRTGIGFLAQLNSIVLRNTQMVKDGEITSYKDLLRPQWKDKIVMDDPSVGGSGAMFMATLAYGVWNIQEARQWLKQMVKQQNMVIMRDPRLQVDWVARGKYPVTLAAWTDQIINFVTVGSPIAMQKVKEGGFITSSNGGIGLYNRPAHPSAATVFINWLLSQEGQTVFASSFGGPSRRKDVKTEGPYAVLMASAADKAYEERTEEQIQNKVKLMKTWEAVLKEK